ncbi:MAG: hypothetical protein ACPL2N_06415 [Candidatus Cryosericum sp.]
MDPLWVLVILVGGASLVTAVAFVVMAVKVTEAAREIGPKLAEIQQQLTGAGAEFAKASASIQETEAQFSQLADKASVASARVTKVVDGVPRVLRTLRQLDLKAEAVVRATGIVLARTIYNARERRDTRLK